MVETTRRRAVQAVGVALGGTLGGCTGNLGWGADAGEVERSSVEVLLNWKTNATQAGYFVAKERGFYEDEGLTVEQLVSGQGGNFAAQQVGLGAYSFGLGRGPALLIARDKDLPVRSYAASQQENPGVVYTVEDAFGGELTDPEQLAGRTVATPEDSPLTTLTTVLLRRAGIREDVEIVDVPADQQTANLLSGNADAAVGIFNSPMALEREGYDASYVRLAEHLPTVGRAIMSRPAFAEEHPNTVRAFLRGTARGWAWAANDPEAAMDLLIDVEGRLAENREMGVLKIKYCAQHLLVSDAVAEHGWGWQRGDDWATVQDALSEAGFVSGDGAVDRAWTNEFLDTDRGFVGDFADAVEAEYEV